MRGSRVPRREYTHRVTTAGEPAPSVANSVAAVIPASGRAQRMGGRKLLLPIGDTVVLGWTCRALLGAGVARVVVVARDDDDELRSWCTECGIDLVPNSHPERGMLGSIHRGIEHLDGAKALRARAVNLLVTPGDLPALQPLSVREVLLAADHHPQALVMPVHAGKRGHPLRIPPDLIGEISSLNPDVGLRHLLAEHPELVHEVEVNDPGVLHDLDTESDYRQLRELIEGR